MIVTTTNTSGTTKTFDLKYMDKDVVNIPSVWIVDGVDKHSSCLHDGCSRCHGTGRSSSGFCVHMISCPCPKCSIMC